jgi:hypothetical protein
MKYLLKLSKRNEFYIFSKHPLAETIVNQTGGNESERNSFLRKHFQIAYDVNSSAMWKPRETFNCLF